MNQLERDRFAFLAALDRKTVAEVLELWALLDLDDMQGSFVDEILPGALDSVTGAQEQAAAVGGRYVDTAAGGLGASAGPQINASGFSGMASDGRSLMDLLVQPFIQTLTAMKIGAPPPLALDAGAEALDRIVTTQVQDAARAAEFTALAANIEVAGYLRVVEPGACDRCIVLAGRFYKWNAGFLRHPKCRCNHSPRTADSEPQDPREQFDAMSAADQDRVFGKAAAAAIRLGAEPNLVVNAKRGMTTATNGRKAPVMDADGNVTFVESRQKATTNVFGQQVYTTTEGTSKRGLAYSRLTDGATGRKKKIVRLMPGSIIQIAAGDRTECLRLLRLHGYVL